MPRLVCPYCFETFRPSKVAFRCINPNTSRCPPEEDKLLGDYLRFHSTLPMMPRVFVPGRQGIRTAISATCSCGISTTKSVCPHCHNDLPNQFGSMDSYNIALIGAKESGKSHYIAVLINELNNRVGYSFDASLNALDERTIQRYKQDFRNYIYDKKEVIPATISARARIDVRYPLAYRFSIQRQRLAFIKRLNVSSLVFFDTAGEDLTHIDLMSTETRYLANSHGIIFLLDPLQIPAIRNLVGNSTTLPSENTDPEEIIGRVATLIRLSRRMGEKAKIKTPVALAFSKIDALRGLFEPGAPVHRSSNHDGFFNITEAQQMSDNIRAHLFDWIGSGLDVFAQHNFKTVSYFGISALGSSPDGQGRLPMGIAPFRVEDPLLWILYKLNIIPGRRNRL